MIELRMVENTVSSIELLKTFSPLDVMRDENLQALARGASRRELAGGRILFREGDSDQHTFYLIEGEIALLRDDRVVMKVQGGTPGARNCLSPFLPRRYTARAVSENVQFLVLNSALLDTMLTWDQTGSFQESELHSRQPEPTPNDQWMPTLLQTKVFQRIPAANIQAICARMQHMDFAAGDTVIKQGDIGDYFYLVVRGRCEVVREMPLNPGGVRLAELNPGDTFGEEALVAETQRNATVRMLEAGTLMRLAKKDFHFLLNEPLLHWVTLQEARDIFDRGGIWIDVRLPGECEYSPVHDAVNIALNDLRARMQTLDRNKSYVLCCDTGRRSSTAAYILSERGFDAAVLKGGLLESGLIEL